MRATEGDPSALEAVVGSADLCALARRMELEVGLLEVAATAGFEGPPVERWRRRRRESAAGWLMIAAAAEAAFPVLAASCERWIPFKGYDLGRRYYPAPEQRPAADIDILIADSEFDAVGSALADAGWEPLREGGERVARYMREEGYASQWRYSKASHRPSVMLEVHHRLWGLVPEGLAEEVLVAARAVPEDGAGAYRPMPWHAYLIAAIHGWNRRMPRNLIDWRDLQMVLSREPDAAGEIVECARRWELELPVCLSAEVAACLWPDSGHDRIVSALEPRLRAGEVKRLKEVRAGGVDAVSLRGIVLARLLAGRPSRAGWKSAWRRVWAHPGVVELETPAEWSWPRRRTTHLTRSFRHR